MNKWEEKRTRPVLPIYLAALVWPVGALLLPTYRLSSVLIIAGASAVVYGLGSKFCPTRVIKKQVPYATGSEDVDAMLTEITAKLDELHELNDEIVAKRFDKAFEAYFVEPFQKWQIQCSKMLRTKIKKYRKCGRNWKSTLMAFLRDDKEYQILDIEQIFAELQDKNGNLSRIKKGFLDAEYRIDHSRYLNRYIEKVNEICMVEKQIYLYTLVRIQQTESDEQKK